MNPIKHKAYIALYPVSEYLRINILSIKFIMVALRACRVELTQ